MSAPAVTQIIYLTVDPDKNLTDAKSEAGRTWTEALRVIENHVGFRRLYWGRSPEDTSEVQLHVGESRSECGLQRCFGQRCFG